MECLKHNREANIVASTNGKWANANEPFAMWIWSDHITIQCPWNFYELQLAEHSCRTFSGAHNVDIFRP